jgi:hypothetical protein
MAKYCICPKCGIRFNREAIQAVKIGARRYGHATCYPDNTDFVPLPEKKTKEVDPDLKALNDYIYHLFGDKTNWAMVKRQIKTYTKENNYSLSGILKSLIYFFEIKNNSIDKANNAIGIVPYCYQDAKEYYYGLWVAQQQNQNKVVTTGEKEIVIKEPRKAGTIKRFFDLGEEE